MLCAILPGEAQAHGLGARYDLPLPLWLYLLGAGAAVAASFAFLTLFRTSARPIKPRSLVFARGRLPWSLVAVLQGLSMGLFLLIVMAGLLGNQNPFKNITPVFVWVIWWVGMTLLAAFVVNPWPLVNPAVIAWEWGRRWSDGFRTSAPGRGRFQAYPPWLGAWPAAALFLLMAWLELIAPGRDIPRNIALGALAYLGLSWIGCRLFGPAVWLRNADPFAVAFAILGRFAPLQVARTGLRGCWWLRPYAVGLLSDRPLSISLTAFTLLMLATVSVDGLLETPAWMIVVELVDRLGTEGESSGDVLATMLLCLAPLVFGGAYLVVIAMMRMASGEAEHSLSTLAGRFVLPLVPIAIAYHLAHYLSFLLLAGQFAIPLASDPFGFGWDLFGTALYRIDIGIVDARFVWLMAVGAIVIGHIVATWLAHETALAVFVTSKAARKSQGPMLVLMVGYTVLSLWILSQPIVEP
ncbi:hypothetical protein DC522_32770 [Microvirga sp. KLBC 81]|uniref:hypothetical protein n=1 Tax=Microvirga sp. KLBC 81 TaxID=1862707 RepID=UPI000D5179D7|nr:hypothetical protein [Microvirga sp. KLBC 81]PVE20369.1 hypothetical protein DC522_32770 [Microvirga sp. KLBC 81]